MTSTNNIVLDGIIYDVINGEMIIDNKTSPIEYGAEYLENYTSLATTPMGIKLAQWRRAYAESWGKNCRHGNKFLDFGCGWSPIIASCAVSPELMGTWNGTDCNELIADLEHMKNRWIPPNRLVLDQYDVVCFFDVIEHLRNYKSILKQIAVGNAIVITVPCYDWKNLPDITSWRHYKPSEHFLYGSCKGWIAEIKKNGFELLDHTTFESAMGRLDSHTFAFRRVV
jgi:hypothetical protein